ncbi:MAG: GDP-mannose 4,6-dehydratase [Patescibacteria group bacterium]|nr:GDP-mannose 4,6-dehydratase [Patescibacteria group bacterium]
MPNSKRKNILITGGAGFIGSHLCERLLKNANVICLDNLSTSKQRNIDHLLQYPNFEFLRHDICEPIDFKKYKELNRFKVDFHGLQEIYHMACPTSAKNFEKFKIDTLTANSIGMKNVLDVAVKYKSKFAHSSTSVVYGARQKNQTHFKEEDLGLYDHLSPRSCYDEGKRFAETCVETYRQVHKLDAKIARVFRTYGPRQRLNDGEMLPDFILDAINGKDLVIYGDKDFATSLCFVDDLTDALIKLMKAPKNTGVVNIGSDMDVKLANVANKIIQMTDSKSKVVFKEPLPFITELGLPDIRKAKDVLGWFPLVGLDSGLEKMVEYVQAHRAILS